MPQLREFSRRGYKTLLKSFLDAGYEFTLFHDVKPDAAQVVMRHDIDLDLGYALEIARIEAEMGVRSTFFFLVSTRFYNPVAAEARGILRAIHAGGHEIGLHFDAAQESCSSADGLDGAVALEASILETALGAPIRCMSFHRPAPQHLGSAERIAGRLNAYAPRFTKSMGYCADSMGRWRFGHPLDHEAFAGRTALQLVTHPVWWAVENEIPTVERLKQFYSRSIESTDASMAENLVPWRERNKGEEPSP
jgi:hypothetical protein